MLLRGVGTCPRAAVSCGAGGVQHSALSGDGLSVCVRLQLQVTLPGDQQEVTTTLSC